METIAAAAISAVAVICAAWITARPRAAAAVAPPPSTADSGPRLGRLRELAARSWALLGKLPPLPRRKRPWVAALVGVFFSGLGIALYFRKGPDILIGIPFLLVFALAEDDSARTSGAPVLAWWYWIVAGLCGLYSLLRAESANRRLDAAAEAPSAPALAP
jgi:hypothetical protein